MNVNLDLPTIIGYKRIKEILKDLRASLEEGNNLKPEDAVRLEIIDDLFEDLEECVEAADEVLQEALNEWLPLMLRLRSEDRENAVRVEGLESMVKDLQRRLPISRPESKGESDKPLGDGEKQKITLPGTV
jgi:hypothetical protein